MSHRKTKRVRFRKTPLHRRSEPHAIHFLTERSSFWVATLSVIAFIVGNMVGQHGWYAFWASVLGGQDDRLIVYTGTVAPIDKVPDYRRWSQYGGNSHEHTYRQVPNNLLVSLPPFNPANQDRHRQISPIGQIYSVGYAGAYRTGGEGDGSHPGVDIRVPIGTPVRSIANGVVDSVRNTTGFGKLIVVRHPNVPDPANPSKTTTLYSSYAHLSSFLKQEGDFVRMGEQIAHSGNTGLSTGPHLHFQIDRADAPWHPYWPFTASEARNVGLSFVDAVNAGLKKERVYEFTVHPMLYVQANYQAPTTVAQAGQSDAEVALRPSADDAQQVARTENPQDAKRASRSARARRLIARNQRLRDNAVRNQRVSPTRQRSVQLASRTQSRSAERARLRLSRRRFAIRSSNQVAARPQQTAVQKPPSIVQKLTPTIAPQSRPTQVVEQTEVVVAGERIERSSGERKPFNAVRILHDGKFNGRSWEEVTVSLVNEHNEVVENPDLNYNIHIRAAYGNAEFQPATITPAQLETGQAIIRMLPRGRRTLVIQAFPSKDLSKPMMFQK